LTRENDLARVLTDEEKDELLKIARQTIACVTAGSRPQRAKPAFPVFEERRGAFVTLHKKKELRGCIGLVQAIRPLVETVVEMAESAALRDPRFRSVRSDEVPEIDIEISVLSPLKQIESLDEIVVGTHGILIERGYYSGLLLPQVAGEYGWDRKAFLEHTCIKAGLNREALEQEGTRIYIFSAEVFGEKERQR
jgi:AmmeMemoRadiSam system protein A